MWCFAFSSHSAQPSASLTQVLTQPVPLQAFASLDAFFSLIPLCGFQGALSSLLPLMPCSGLQGFPIPQNDTVKSQAFQSCVLHLCAASPGFLHSQFCLPLRSRSASCFPAMFDLGCWMRSSGHQVVSPFSPALPFSLERR
jgi:hypothetical protein